MRTHEVLTEKGAIVVNKDAFTLLQSVLNRLGNDKYEAVMRGLGGKPETFEPPPKEFGRYSGALSDGASVKFDRFSELLDFPNSSHRRLVRIEANLIPVLGSDYAISVVMGGKEIPLVIEIDGDERDTAHARQLCSDLVARTRRSYGWMYRRTFEAPMVMGWIIAAFVWFISMMSLVQDAINQRKWTFVPVAERDWLNWSGIVVFVFFMYFVARGYFWPRVVFDIGQERERSELRTVRRRWVITGLFAALIVGMFGRYIGNKLGL